MGDLFTFEENFDRGFLDFDKYAGIRPGADWEKTLDNEIEACQAGSDLQSIDLTSDREGGLERLFMALNETGLQSPEGFKLEKGTSPFTV